MRKSILLLSLLLSLPLFAQKVKTVEGEYTYHVPRNVSPAEAERTALERAKIQALADAFGTVVTQHNATRVKNSDGESSTDFFSDGASEVRGRWIETIGQPEFRRAIEGDELIITCRVKGKAREIVRADIDLEVHVLRNGIEDRFESDRFKDHDDLYLSFRSPIRGFLAVYLVDNDGEASCLLPYRNQQDGIYPVEANRRYVFFSREAAGNNERSLVEEYYMTCNHTAEHNVLYLIFSPTPFTKAADAATLSTLPRQLPQAEFRKWLAKCQRHDEDMRVQRVGISVEK